MPHPAEASPAMSYLCSVGHKPNDCEKVKHEALSRSTIDYLLEAYGLLYNRSRTGSQYFWISNL